MAKLNRLLKSSTHNMAAVIQNLKQEGAFRTHYHAELGAPTGQRNHLIGLPATGLFLEILGVRLLAGGSVELLHKNPFPWEVKLSWRGTSITCTHQDVTVKFPNGESITVIDQIPCLVENTSHTMWRNNHRTRTRHTPCA